MATSALLLSGGTSLASRSGLSSFTYLTIVVVVPGLGLGFAGLSANQAGLDLLPDEVTASSWCSAASSGARWIPIVEAIEITLPAPLTWPCRRERPDSAGPARVARETEEVTRTGPRSCRVNGAR